MSRISELCDQLMHELRELGSVTPDSILPGLTKEEILAKTKHLPFQLPQSAIDLYQWGNGYRCEEGEPCFISLYYFQSLEKMLENYAALSADTESPRFHSGNQRWFPLLNFYDDGVDYLSIVCENEPTADGQIVDDDKNGDHRDNVTPPVVKYQSLEKLLETTIDALQRGVCYLDEDGVLMNGIIKRDEEGNVLGVHDRAFTEIACSHNPEVEYWAERAQLASEEEEDVVEDAADDDDDEDEEDEVQKWVQPYSSNPPQPMPKVPFQEWRALIKTALADALKLHTVALRTLSAYHPIDAIDFSFYEDGQYPALSFHLENDNDARDIKKGDWLLFRVLDQRNCPSLVRLYDEIKQSEDKVPYLTHLVPEHEYLMCYAAAEALLDPEIVALLNQCGINAYFLSERYEQRSFEYYVNRYSSVNHCDSVISRRILDYQTNPNYEPLVPPQAAWRWNRPPLEDMQGILCHRPPMGRVVEGLQTVVYENMRRSKPRITRWHAFPNTDEHRRQNRFYKAANWRAWRTQAELAALVAKPGKYVLYLTSTGAMAYMRCLYLNDEKEGIYPFSTATEVDESPVFESSAEIIKTVNRLTTKFLIENEKVDDEHPIQGHYWYPVLLDDARELQAVWDELEKEDPWMVDLVNEKIAAKGGKDSDEDEAEDIDDEDEDDKEEGNDFCDDGECEFDDSDDVEEDKE